MRGFLILVVLLLNVFSSYAYDDCRLYKLALDTILTLRGITCYCDVAVCDSIIDMDRWWFAEYFHDFPIEQDKLKWYDFNKQYEYNKNEYSDCLHQLFPNTSICDNIIFFSQIVDNILLAEFVDNVSERMNSRKINDPMNYSEVVRYNVSDRYAILFNEDDKIKYVICISITYD